ncbi:hypothetical protein GTA08_BOTSDO08246 [Neofusicoccum parvum]|uniref:Uncharacterized protein n=1 Tax=Neofusicoccum parvum TaxID=310453 RepID=A0ACB5SH67_9PEZI|nr:hypothetical protein GTA08_BOTSDO08246 [Neofusicoccum parvum]
MDLVQSIRKDGSRGSAAIGDNVDVENIRNSNHRENYLGHSILAPVGRSERRRDQLFWARNNAAIDVEDEEIKQERKEAQIRERRALNEHLGRPIDEGIEELINGPKPAQPVVANPNLVAVGSSKDSKERKERRHKHHHPSVTVATLVKIVASAVTVIASEVALHVNAATAMTVSAIAAALHANVATIVMRASAITADDRPQRHRTREMSLERSRNDYVPRRDRDRDREGSFASERRPISRRGSFSHY